MPPCSTTRTTSMPVQQRVSHHQQHRRRPRSYSLSEHTNDASRKFATAASASFAARGCASKNLAHAPSAAAPAPTREPLSRESAAAVGDKGGVESCSSGNPQPKKRQ